MTTSKRAKTTKRTVILGGISAHGKARFVIWPTTKLLPVKQAPTKATKSLAGRELNHRDKISAKSLGAMRSTSITLNRALKRLADK
jgi:hypothetical protein